MLGCGRRPSPAEHAVATIANVQGADSGEPCPCGNFDDVRSWWALAYQCSCDFNPQACRRGSGESAARIPVVTSFRLSALPSCNRT
jgi:hypothetical protein